MRLPHASAGRAQRLGSVLIIAGMAALSAGATRPGSARATATTLASFTTPGTYEWVVPTGITSVTFDVFGAQGGNVVEHSSGHTLTTISNGGAGGQSKAKFKVKPGDAFEIYVGGMGGTATLEFAPATGGFNGGGSGDIKYSTMSGGGGGASDVRIGGISGTCAAAMTCTLDDRIVVGGGGGGGGVSYATGVLSGVNGDPGGGASGLGDGGTQQEGGDCSPNPSGTFGTGANANDYSGIGAGGGGWYGGGCANIGSGGSGYIDRFALSGSFPAGTRQGDGKVIISG